MKLKYISLQYDVDTFTDEYIESEINSLTQPENTQHFVGLVWSEAPEELAKTASEAVKEYNIEVLEKKGWTKALLSPTLKLYGKDTYSVVFFSRYAIVNTVWESE